MRIILILLGTLVAYSSGLVFVTAQDTQEAGPAGPIDWRQLDFKLKLDNGDVYRITKLVFDVPKNAEAPWKKGIFADRRTELKQLVIADRDRLRLVESSLGSFLRLEQHGAVSSYMQNGKITVFTTKGSFHISISNTGFTLGTGYPSDKNIFFDWTLAKLLDDEARRQYGTGLKPKTFDVLSGLHWINGRKMNYEKAFGANKVEMNPKKE